MTEPVSVTVSSGVAISAKSTSRTPGDHVAGLARSRRPSSEYAVIRRLEIGLAESLLDPAESVSDVPATASAATGSNSPSAVPRPAG